MIKPVRKNIISWITTFTILTFCFSCDAPGLGKTIYVHDLFIDKDYGDLKRSSNLNKQCSYVRGIHGSGKGLSVEQSGIHIDTYCHFSYYSINDGALVSITVVVYDDPAYAQNDLIVNKIFWDEIDKTLGREEVGGISTPSISDDGKYLLYLTGSGPDRRTWVSGKNQVFFQKRGDGEHNTILQDYISKYPPTALFTKQDFKDKEKVIKKDMKKLFSSFMLHEQKRSLINRIFRKSTEYDSMTTQCFVEMQLRCFIEDTNEEGKVGCPTSFTLDKSERIEKWNELEERYKDSAVNLDILKFGPVPTGHCHSPVATCDVSEKYSHERAADKLGYDAIKSDP